MSVQVYPIGSAGTLALDVNVKIVDDTEGQVSHIAEVLQTAAQEMTEVIGETLDEYVAVYSEVELQPIHYTQGFSAVYGDISLSYSLTFDLVADPSIMVMGVMMELVDYIDQRVRYEVGVHLSGDKFRIHFLEHEGVNIHAYEVNLDDESGELRFTPVV